MFFLVSFATVPCRKRPTGAFTEVHCLRHQLLGRWHFFLGPAQKEWGDPAVAGSRDRAFWAEAKAPLRLGDRHMWLENGVIWLWMVYDLWMAYKRVRTYMNTLWMGHSGMWIYYHYSWDVIPSDGYGWIQGVPAIMGIDTSAKMGMVGSE